MMKHLTLWIEIALSHLLALSIFAVMFTCVCAYAAFAWLSRRMDEGPPAGWDYDGIQPTPHKGYKGCAPVHGVLKAHTTGSYGLEPNIDGRVTDADNTYA